jgi:hypothetical protein
MFVFNRSAIAVLAPLGLLVAVVLWSSLASAPVAAPANAAQSGQTSQEQVARVNQARDSES